MRLAPITWTRHPTAEPMKSKTALILTSITATSFPAHAQDFLLDPLIVTASRTEQTLSETPYSSSLIDQETLRENAIRTVPDALALTPGVLVQKTAHGHGSPFIRGFTGRQNLLLIDGIRLNNSTLRSGPVQYWNTVDALSIDHLELIRSQGSVAYGSDAVGGTLNLFSKSSDFHSKPEGAAYTNGSTSYEFRSNGQGSHIGRLELESGIGGKFGVWLGLSAKDFGDIEDSSVGRMHGTGYPEEALDFRLDAALTPDSTLTFAHQSFNQDNISRWHRTLANPGWEHGNHSAAPGSWTANTYDQERSLTYLRYAGENPESSAAIDHWSATLSYQTATDSEFQNRNPASNSIRHSNIDLQTIGFDLTLESSIGHGSLVYGLDYYHDSVDSSGSRNNSAGTAYRELLPIADDSDYDLFGIFAQYTWKPIEPLEITTGLRHTRASATLGRFYDPSGNLQTDESADWDSTVGSLRANYEINPDWNLYGGLSQAFRAPNLDDLSGNLTAKAGSTSLGSTDVDPEKFLTAEIGVRHMDERVSFSFGLFHTWIDDLISTVPVTDGSSTTITTNAASGYIYGVELDAAWRFHPQWTLSGFAAWQEGRNEIPEFLGGPANEKPMTRQLPLTGSLSLRWSHPSDKFWVESRLTAAASEDRITARDQAADNQRIPTNGTPGYLVAEIHAGWRVNENLALSCCIENLTDQDYRHHGSGQNEPGWNGIIAAKLSW